MDKNEKAAKVKKAVEKVVAELRAEGKDNIADRTLNAFKDVPVGSLARLHDLFGQFGSKQEALNSLGADA